MCVLAIKKGIKITLTLLSLLKTRKKEELDWLLKGSLNCIGYSHIPETTFLKCLKAFLPPCKPPAWRAAQRIRGMRESSAIRDRDSCKLQPLFQKRGLRAMTEPLQPRPATLRPHNPALCSHTERRRRVARTHRCIQKLLTPSQQYTVVLRWKEDLARRKMAAPLPSHPSSCVLSNDCLSSKPTKYRPLTSEDDEHCVTLLFIKITAF